MYIYIYDDAFKSSSFFSIHDRFLVRTAFRGAIRRLEDSSSSRAEDKKGRVFGLNAANLQRPSRLEHKKMKLLLLIGLLAVLSVVNGADVNRARFPRAASPIRWGKRSQPQQEVLRWGKREPLRWGKRSTDESDLEVAAAADGQEADGELLHRMLRAPLR